MDGQDCPQISGAGPSELHEHEQELNDNLILQILTEEQYWLSHKPQNLESTPYSHITHIQFIIGPYACSDGTVMHFNISKDGQTVSYSKDRVTWHDINYQKWSTLILEIISRIKDKIIQSIKEGTTQTG
ncbi:hypothetical protein L208DRAFT_1382651 [Tricholoma matsutake]|nr:hypothetical protein L208DRAFT_1382651 [Tricholoma matsutake 945]